MVCTTFFFGCLEDADQGRACLDNEGIEYQSFNPAPDDQLIRVWAISVKSDAASRAREALFIAAVTLIGYYDLPALERPLPEEPESSGGAEAAESLIKRMWLAFVAQCFADTEKIRLIAHIDGKISSLFAYLNSTLKAAQYNPDGPTLTFRKGIRIITLYRRKIAIAKADDLLDAWLCLQEIRDLIDDVARRKDEITPNFAKSEPPSALAIYKLLPRTNCALCGEPTCMAFAALVAGGEAELTNCSPLFENEFAESRSELLALLGN